MMNEAAGTMAVAAGQVVRYKRGFLAMFDGSDPVYNARTRYAVVDDTPDSMGRILVDPTRRTRTGWSNVKGAEMKLVHPSQLEPIGEEF